jgi:hypothetical protein
MRAFRGLVLLCALAAGCSSAQRGGEIAPLAAHDPEGIVVLSITQDQVNGSYVAYPEVFMNGRPRGPKLPTYRVLESRERAFGFDFKASEIPGVYGRVLALRLPAGMHSLNYWEIWHGRPPNNPVRPEPAAPLAFEVKAGEVAYLGNLHFRLQMGAPGPVYGPNATANAIASAITPAFGVQVVRVAYPEVRDERARDVAIFEGRYPALKGKVVPAMLKIGPW